MIKEKEIVYRCKFCNLDIDVEKIEIVNVSEYGIIYKCNNCAGANSWGFVVKH